MATPLATLTFDGGTDGSALAAGGVITAVSGTSNYSSTAAIHGALGLTTSTGSSTGPTFTVTKASLGVTATAHTVSIYFEPVTLPGGAIQIGVWQSAANANLLQLRCNNNTKHFDLFTTAIVGASTLTWTTGTRYRLDVTYDGTTTFTVKVFAGSNVEGTVADDTFTGTSTSNTFDHLLMSPGRSTTAGCVGYLDTIRFYDGVVTPDPFAPPAPGGTVNLTGASVLSILPQGQLSLAGGSTLAITGVAQSVVHHWQGAPTASGFRVVSRTTGCTLLRLAVSISPDMSGPTYFSGGSPDAAGYISISATGLVAGTRYYYQLENTPSGGAGLLFGPIGRAKTLPASNSHRIALGSCITTGASDSSALDSVVAWDPDLFVFTGDLDYSGDTSTDANHQRATYENQITSATGMLGLLRDVPWAYCVSDHEAGPDNGDSNNLYTAANISAYEQIVPTYPLVDSRVPTVGRYQTWVIGRVRYIMLDIRNTDRSPGANTDDTSKTMLGATQKAWLKTQLTAAEPVKVIISDVAWLGPASITNGADKWWSYATERQEIADYITANNVKCLLWHGDTHSLAVATPAKNTWGSFPVYCASPMHNVGGGLNLSSFSSFWNNSGGAARTYGRITVTDTGSAITFQFSGWDAAGTTERVAQTDTFAVSVPTTGSGTISVLGDGQLAVTGTGVGNVAAKWKFTTPIFQRRYPVIPPVTALMNYSKAVLRIDGQWVETEWPTEEQINASDYYFPGGYEIEVDQATADVLAAAGYTVTPEA